MGPKLFHLALRLDGERCLVVGGGPVGARKAESLLDCGALVTVVAPQICEALGALGTRGEGGEGGPNGARGPAGRCTSSAGRTGPARLPNTASSSRQQAGRTWTGTSTSTAGEPGSS